MLCDTEVDEYVRSSIFGAVAFLTWEGRIDASVTRAFLERLDDQRLIPDEDWNWFAWSAAVELLGWDAMSPRVEQAYRDDRIARDISALADYRRGRATSWISWWNWSDTASAPVRRIQTR